MEVSLNKEAILERLGGNHQLFETICNSFLKLLPSQLGVIQEAVSNKDGDTLSRAAHRLKGSVAYFDSGAVTSTIVEIESLCKQPTFDDARARHLFERLASLLQELIKELEVLRHS